MTDTSNSGTYRTGNVQFKKSQNGVRIEFTDQSHDPVELSTDQWQKLLQNIEPQYAQMLSKGGQTQPV